MNTESKTEKKTMLGQEVLVCLGANGIILDEKAFYYFSDTRHFHLECVYKNNGNTQYSEKSEKYKFYKHCEMYLTLSYNDLYCPTHCRRVDDGECDLCNR